MGLLDAYAKLEDAQPNSFDLPDDAYEFIVKRMFIKEGSASQPDVDWVVIEYILTNKHGRDANYGELFRLPEDPDRPTEREAQTLGRYLSRLLSFGLNLDEAREAESEDIEGIEGTLQLVTQKGRTGGSFQNIRSLRVGERDIREEAAPAPAAARRRRAVEEAEPAPAAPKRTRAPRAPLGDEPEADEKEAETVKPARRRAATKPAPEPEPEEETYEEEAEDSEEIDDRPMATADYADKGDAEPSLEEQDNAAKARLLARRASRLAVNASTRKNALAE